MEVKAEQRTWNSSRGSLTYFCTWHEHLRALIEQYGAWTYLILCVVVFCETGLMITPILPGDSLLFAVGALAAMGALDVSTVVVLLIIAAIAGDTINYACGHFLEPKVFHASTSRFWNRGYLRATRRKDDRARAIPADHPDVRAVCRGSRPDVVWPLRGLQRRQRGHVGGRLRRRRVCLRHDADRS